MTKFRSAYQPSLPVRKEFTQPTRTQQHMRDECNVNLILKKWQKTGLITHINEHSPQYGDLIPFSDYQTSLNQIMEAQASFDALPSSLRKKFDNDPAQFVNFVSDGNNADELVALGLATHKGVASADQSAGVATPLKATTKAKKTAPMEPLEPNLFED